MLIDLRIQNFGVITEADVDFHPGLTIFTGETGAGKTLVVSGIGQLLGGRGESAIVKHGATRALVEGRWSGNEKFEELLAQLGMELEDGELLTSRQILNSGRSKAFMAGNQTTLATMSKVLGQLAIIYGQSEQIQLGSLERQREMLDNYANNQELNNYQLLYSKRQKAIEELSRLQTDALERAREIDLLSYGLAEVTKISPISNEDEELRTEYDRLQAADNLRQLAIKAQEALNGSEDIMNNPGAMGLVYQARMALEEAAKVDKQAVPLAKRLAELNFELNDLGAEVSSYLADLVVDPLRLETVVSRLAELAILTRKYGHSINEVLDWAESATKQLATLQGSDELIADLEKNIAELTQKLEYYATKISQIRQESAAKLAKKCEAELSALSLGNARLTFKITPLDKLGPHGKDRIELMFSANPDTSLAPLAKVASGGELSRVRLALEVVLGADKNQTLIFDEVDAGVGGAVGLEIGRRLAKLATQCQVVVVTHLAQVAAFADHHYVVTKAVSEGNTKSGIKLVTGKDREIELARMMSGIANSPVALEHAKELLKEAKI